MKILFSVCTQSEIQSVSDTKFVSSVFPSTNPYEYREGDNVFLTNEIGDAIIKCNNKESICKHYNKSIDYAIVEEYDTVIFCHDDILIEDKFLVNKLTEGFKENDVIGLAGARTCSLKKPILWHLMSDRSTWSGAVAHPASDNSLFVTAFGPSPMRCLVLDGLFLAVKVESLIKSCVRFDENIPCIAHFYDIDFCLNANSKKLKLTTWPIWAVHSSPGLSGFTDEFKRGEDYIIDKWKRN